MCDANAVVKKKTQPMESALHKIDNIQVLVKPVNINPEYSLVMNNVVVPGIRYV